jgi:hypothetical protein
VTFDRQLVVDLGGCKVETSFLGRGNTGGDAVIYVPMKALAAIDDGAEEACPKRAKRVEWDLHFAPYRQDRPQIRGRICFFRKFLLTTYTVCHTVYGVHYVSYGRRVHEPGSS